MASSAVRQALAFIIGLLAFSAAELVWLLIRLRTGQHSKWTLEATPGLLLAAGVILLAMVWLGDQRMVERSRFVAEPFMAYAGVCVSLTAWLFVVGAGNPWPIVLVFDYVLVAPSVFIGWGFLGRDLAEDDALAKGAPLP
ncbi:MAG: hypothetical protein AB1486_08060 [Planctomycetota bacterium]